MATRGRDGTGSNLPDAPGNGSQTELSGPDTRNHETSWRPEATCRWRTRRYHDQECSRYFDCPSHLVERALSDDGQEAGEGHDEMGDTESENENDDPDPGSVSPLSEEEGGSDQAARSRLPDRPRQRVDSEGSTSDAGVPAPPVPGPAPRGTGVVSLAQAAQGLVPAAASPTTLAPRQSPTVAQRSGTSEMVLPRWQPDSEVTYCPICRTQFSFFVRKHHCRKCGRVVCNSCSPHRITIPHQYIVRPPGAPGPPAPVSPFDSPGWFPDFSGGERVRLCNPCVPDPNTAPPQSPGVHAGSPTSPAVAPQTEGNLFSSRWGFYFGGGPANDAQARGRSATMHPGVRPSVRAPVPPFPLQNTQHRILSGTPPIYYQPPTTSRNARPYPNVPARYRSMLDIGGGGGDGPGPSSSAAAAYRSLRPVPAPQPQPQIPEEDECPVCHRELPPRTLPNFDSLRESHITSCIAAHSAYGGGGGGSSAAATSDGGGDGGPPRPRRTGMFPYTATEKDCVDSAECSICLEEFEVGVPMARLECLCRFHRRCIAAWWERHPGRCPMHQHDGFGY
ncbi:hypothetical protein VTK26DRAFT_728 [Humicola hyalothermophila]